MITTLKEAFVLIPFRNMFHSSLTYPARSIPTKYTAPSITKIFLTSAEPMPAASLAWGSNMDSMNPKPQKFTTLSMYGVKMAGLWCPRINNEINSTRKWMC